MKTIKKKIYLIASLAMALVTLVGCSKDGPLNLLGDCGSGGWAQQISKELNDWSVAESNYSDDPSLANCNANKSAAKSYLDALEGVRSCVLGASRSEFNAAIAEAKKDIDETDCSE